MKTIMRVFTFLLLFAVSTQLAAQKGNLVRNPGFETISPGQALDQIGELNIADGWSSPNQGAPKLYTTVDGHIYDPLGSAWPFKARSGANVSGIHVYGGMGSVARREYVQGVLLRPLTVGKKYYFSFYVHYHCEGANNIGIAFLPAPIKSETMGVLPLAAVGRQHNITRFNNAENTWTQVRDSFIAYQPFTNFVIGNFYPNAETKIESNRYNHHFAFIDDIEITEAEQATVAVTDTLEKRKWEKNVQLAAKSKGNTPVILPPLEIYFDYDQAQLRPEEAARLDQLLRQMVAAPGNRIRISGFASAEGATGYNLRLSERRAETVKNYLIQKGVSAAGIVTGAYGEATPAATNKTPVGREKNRRVKVEINW